MFPATPETLLQVTNSGETQCLASPSFPPISEPISAPSTLHAHTWSLTQHPFLSLSSTYSCEQSHSSQGVSGAGSAPSQVFYRMLCPLLRTWRRASVHLISERQSRNRGHSSSCPCLGYNPTSLCSEQRHCNKLVPTKLLEISTPEIFLLRPSGWIFFTDPLVIF